MKKLILTGTLLICVTCLTKAQDQSAPTPPPAARQAPPSRPMPSPESMADRKAKYMQTQLALTQEQYKSVYDAELAFAKLLAQTREPQPGGARPDPRAMDKANTEREAKYKAVLTPEQWTKYQGLKQQPPRPAATPSVK